MSSNVVLRLSWIMFVNEMLLKNGYKNTNLFYIQFVTNYNNEIRIPKYIRHCGLKKIIVN